jgi:hypothetical protein
MIISTVVFLSCNNADNSVTNTISDTTSLQKKDTLPVKELLIDKDDDGGLCADVRVSIRDP